MSRDNYHRCKHCKGLFPDEDCIPDTVSGVLQCPNGCRDTFQQPAYESPLH